MAHGGGRSLKDPETQAKCRLCSQNKERPLDGLGLVVLFAVFWGMGDMINFTREMWELFGGSH